MNELAWVAETAMESEAQGFDRERRITFDDGPFAGFIERVPLRPGMALYRGLTDFFLAANICKW